MGCYSSKGNIEDLVKEFWKQNPIFHFTIKQYVDAFEKLTAYKKDIRTSNGFNDNVLNKLFYKEVNNQTNEYMKKNYLEITSSNDICIPIALMFLTQSKDYLELVENYSKLFHIVRGRVDNSRKIKNDISGLKEILKVYISLVTLNTFDTIYQKLENKGEEDVKAFFEIYSKDSIERNFSKLFIFENENEKTDNVENDENEVEMDIRSPKEISNFFKINFGNLNSDLIREKLYIFHEKKLIDEKNKIFVKKSETEEEGSKRASKIKRKTENFNRNKE